jgi:hypothetical protein
MASLAVINKETILDQIRAGVRLSEIGSALGISASAISQALSSSPDYQDALRSFHDSRIDAAEGLIESSEDQLNLARAREVWKAYSWRAERLDKRYAAKQELSIEHINMSDAISKGRQRARLIEGEAATINDSDNP